MAVPASGRSLGSLQLGASFSSAVNPFTCPHGTPTSTSCYASEGTTQVPGLGTVTEAFDETISNTNSCLHTTFSGAMLTVTGKGELTVTLTDSTACDPDFTATVTDPFTITGGTGPYAGATGSGTLTFSNFQPTGSNSSHETHAWAGQVNGPTFDTTAPVISGTKSLTARTKKKSVRVQFHPTATDAVDGTEPVSCLPKSGSRFSIGKTVVTCTATAGSANTATARFTVKVKRRR